MFQQSACELMVSTIRKLWSIFKPTGRCFVRINEAKLIMAVNY